MTILSKIVRRECRGAMYGICASSGALGGVTAIGIGYLISSEYFVINPNAISICLILTLIVVFYLARINEMQYLPRPSLQKRKSVGKEGSPQQES
mmetsp:Transcript_11384/g.11401  ORF Transcript_11384/g.11401 Transcript_11384/m.11401 type:complete len:95 (-) Transcript_11384:41-325(-)